MASTGVINATGYRMTLVTVSESVEMVAREKSVEINFEGDKINITTKDSEGWEENMAGLKRWNGSGTAIWDFSPGTGFKSAQAFITEFLSGDRKGVATFGTSVAGDKKINGSIIIDSLKITAQMESALEISFAFTGAGKPTETTNA